MRIRWGQIKDVKGRIVETSLGRRAIPSDFTGIIKITCKGSSVRVLLEGYGENFYKYFNDLWSAEVFISELRSLFKPYKPIRVYKKC